VMSGIGAGMAPNSSTMQGMRGPGGPGGAGRPGGPPSPEKMFSRVDEDGSGSVDKAEFSEMAERLQERTGVSIDVDAAMEEMDTDGDGVLSQEELGTGMKALMEEQGIEPPPRPPMDGGYDRSGQSQGLQSASSELSAYSLVDLEA